MGQKVGQAAKAYGSHRVLNGIDLTINPVKVSVRNIARRSSVNSFMANFAK